MQKNTKFKLDKYFLPNIEKARKRIKSSNTITDSLKITEKQQNLGVGKKFFVRTYGCQSNVRDTETIHGILELMGYKLAKAIEDADLVILNTCAIRENAEQKVFGEIGFLKKKVDDKKEFVFGICGCMAQEESVIHRIINKVKYINFVVGTHNLYDIPNVIEEHLETKHNIVKVLSEEGDVIENLPVLRSNKIKAFVNIMYGCDNFCTYCIVPYTRGRIRSRNKNDILREINELIKDGYKEVTLLGQNVNSYGVDLNQNYLFSDLLKDVAGTGIERVRFATSNPWNFDKKIVDIMSENKNIMPYIHLPIQSGDEQILKLMNREMKIQKYIDLITYIKKKIPNCSITTDLIVGFPNETNKQFENTLVLYEKVKFDNAYTFIFSPRIGTSAANLKDIIPYSEKQERLAKLNDLVKKYASENNKKWIGKVVPVLVEGKSKTKDNILTGYTPEWKVVNFVGKATPGTTVYVEIVSNSRFSLNGKQKDTK